MHPPLTRCLLENDDLRLEVDQRTGASITDFSIMGPRSAWWPLMRRAPAIIPGGEQSACYLLSPWSNRIDGGVFAFAGETRRVRVNWPDGTAIHGDVRDRAWTILDRSPVSARLRIDSREQDGSNWPWSYLTEVRYELAGSTFETELVITNVDDSPMPVGGGYHPFFNRTLWNMADDPVVKARVTGRYPTQRVMVTGPAVMDDLSRRLNQGCALREDLDDIFETPGGEISIQWPASGVRATFESTSQFSKMVIFSPMHTDGSPYPFFCVEPVSMVNDGFNLALTGKVPAHGVRILEPGQELRLGWKLRIEKT
ncbi:MAG TPA: hypothetical protein VK176_07160 [Phycisphaerales bacterium]|nr:hypothetical protein [Phycisphaerales bacterium]